MLKIKGNKIYLFFLLLFPFGFTSTSLSQTPITTITGHEKAVIAVAFSPNSKYLASVASDKTIKVWTVPEGKLIRTLADGTEGEVAIDFTADGKYLISGGWDKSIKVWDIQKGTVIKRMNGHSLSLRTVAGHPNGKLFASAGWDKKIKIWALPDCILLNDLELHDQCIRAISFSSNGKFLASGGYDMQIKIWDIINGKEIFALKGHKFPIEAISYSPDNVHLATGSLDKTIKIWDTEQGKFIKTLEGHTDNVYAVNYSPDGKYIVSGSNDKSIKIWDAINYTNIATLNVHQAAIKSVCFSPNGKYIASASVDKTIRIWDVSKYNIQPISQQVTPTECTQNQILKSIVPVAGEYTEVYERDYKLKINVNDNAYKDFRLFLNNAEYLEYDGYNKFIVKPTITKNGSGTGIDLNYNIYLKSGINQIKLYAENKSNASYTFSEPINIGYFNLDSIAKSRNLYVNTINVNKYKDNKLNSDYTTNSTNENLNQVFKTQEGSYYKTTIISNIELIDNQASILLNKNIVEISKNTNPNNIAIYLISGLFVSNKDGKIFLLPQNAEKNKYEETAISLDQIIEQLMKINCNVGLLFDISNKIEKPNSNIDNVSEDIIYNYLVKILSSKQNNLNIIIYNNTNKNKLYDLLTQSFDLKNDIDNNKAINFKEISLFLNKTAKTKVILGKDKPIFFQINKKR